VYFLKGSPALEKEFLLSGAFLHHDLSSVNTIRKIKLLRNYINILKPDVIHAHLPAAELVSCFSITKESKYIITRHFGGQFFPNKNFKFSSLLGRFASKKACSVIAISNHVKRILIMNNEVYDNRKIKRVYYGFSKLNFTKPTSNKNNKYHRLNLNDKITIGTVSRLSPEKDLETLICAFARIAKKNNNFELKIAGDGELKSNLMNLCIKLEIANKVKFVGKVTNTVKFYKSLDIFVLSSKYEGFGMVLLEAMACGLPIVAANNTAIKEVLGHSGAGLLFKTSNQFDLVKKINQCLEIKSEGMIMAQEKQLQSFSDVVMAKNIQKLYRQKLHHH
jgi:glycosyltransferase involved in cell wall biosynthesis